MKRITALIFFSLALLSCQKENSFFFPASDFAKSWVPSNQDSIVFTDSTEVDTLYLTYNNYRTFNKPKENNTTLQEVGQNGFSSDSNFFINYLLQAGTPQSDSLGNPFRLDRLRLNSTNTFRELYISNSTLGGDLIYLDTLVFPDSTLYFNVLTDGSDYFMTRSDAIIQFKSSGKWYYRK